MVLITKEQIEIPLDVGMAPIRDGEKITEIVLAFRDISERRKMETMLTDAQQMLANTLTPREKEILQYMVDGSSTKEIAFDLDISTRTVEAHRNNMRQKLNVHDIAMLIRCAITHRLVRVH